MSLNLDSIKGMFIGAFLGDALGAPHEFDRGDRYPYTGRLEYPIAMSTRWQGVKTASVGQVTDDSEMTLALLRCLLVNEGYHRDKVILAYLHWANSGGWMMGKNTRALFKGISTVRGYEARIAKVLALEEPERSQSNGPLMRASPLALLEGDEVVRVDTSLSNPHPLVIEANILYVRSLRRALQGQTPQEILSLLISEAQNREIKTALTEEERDLKTNKGWCLHGLYCVAMGLRLLIKGYNYPQIMQWVIAGHRGSDTDTNACITGAMIGALLGYEALNGEETTKANIAMVTNLDTHQGACPRPVEYGLRDFETLMSEANRVLGSK